MVWLEQETLVEPGNKNGATTMPQGSVLLSVAKSGAIF